MKERMKTKDIYWQWLPAQKSFQNKTLKREEEHQRRDFWLSEEGKRVLSLVLRENGLKSCRSGWQEPRRQRWKIPNKSWDGGSLRSRWEKREDKERHTQTRGQFKYQWCPLLLNPGLKLSGCKWLWPKTVKLFTSLREKHQSVRSSLIL